MKVLIQDVAALSSIRPFNLIGYLRSRGWTKFSEVSGRFSVWSNSAFPEAEIVVPLTRELLDFAQRLGDVLAELSGVEDRSQIDILRDLINSGFDVIRPAVQTTNTDSGTVRIDDGVKFFTQSREILLAAACSTIAPRPVFHSRKPQQALDYINTARLGQTEHGSYVLTLLSPVAPQLTPHGETDLFPGDPFERQVVKTLAIAVRTTLAAAETAAQSGPHAFVSFQEGVKSGISANLCEGIAGLFGSSDLTTVKLSVAWAQNRDAPDIDRSPIVITSDVQPYIEEAARVFRATDELEGYEVIGPVVRLERPDGQYNGTVTVYAAIEGVTRKVNVPLDAKEYGEATRAHSQGKSVKIIGTVLKKGKSYRAENTSSFAVIEHDDNDD